MRDQEHSRRKVFRKRLQNKQSYYNHINNVITMVLTERLLLTGTCPVEHHCSFRIPLLPFIPLSYPSSLYCPLCMTNISGLPHFPFLGRPSMYNWIRQAGLTVLSPYLCPDCSETWNQSPHYRWLSPENQKRSDWPQTHGGSVCRDSSPLRNLFEYHLRWRAPSLREVGDRQRWGERWQWQREGQRVG